MGECPPKPRQTQRDKFAKRPIVEAYRTWCDECRLAATGSPIGRIQAETVIGIIAFFHLPVPESWSEAKKQLHYGRLHRNSGDVDNRLKSCMDALFQEDKGVAIVQGFKLYVEEGEAARTDLFLLTVPPATQPG